MRAQMQRDLQPARWYSGYHGCGHRHRKEKSDERNSAVPGDWGQHWRCDFSERVFRKRGGETTAPEGEDLGAVPPGAKQCLPAVFGIDGAGGGSWWLAVVWRCH